MINYNYNNHTEHVIKVVVVLDYYFVLTKKCIIIISHVMTLNII